MFISARALLIIFIMLLPQTLNLEYSFRSEPATNTKSKLQAVILPSKLLTEKCAEPTTLFDKQKLSEFEEQVKKALPERIIHHSVNKAFTGGTNNYNYHNAVRILSYELGRGYQDYLLHQDIILTVWLNRLIKTREEYLSLYKQTGKSIYLQHANNPNRLVKVVAKKWNPGDARNWDTMQSRAKHRWIKQQSDVYNSVNKIAKKNTSPLIKFLFSHGIREYSHPHALRYKYENYPLYYVGHMRNKHGYTYKLRGAPKFIRGKLTETNKYGNKMTIAFALDSKNFGKNQSGEIFFKYNTDGKIQLDSNNNPVYTIKWDTPTKLASVPQHVG